MMRGSRAAYDVALAPDLVLADAGAGLLGLPHLAVTGVDRRVVGASVLHEDQDVAGLLLALGDVLALELGTGRTPDLLARLLVDVLHEARAVEGVGSVGAVAVRIALLLGGPRDDL